MQGLLTIAVATVLCEGGRQGFLFLIDWSSEYAVSCEKVFWKGEGGGCKTLKANRNIVCKNVLEEMRGVLGGMLDTDFPLRAFLPLSCCAIELHRILYSINIKLYN